MLERKIGNNHFKGIKVLGADGDNTVFGSAESLDVPISSLAKRHPDLPYLENKNTWRQVITRDSWLYLTFRLAEKHGWYGDAHRMLVEHETIYTKFWSQRDKPGAFSQMMNDLMQLWTMDGSIQISRSEIIDIISEIPVRDGVHETLKLAQTLGIETALFTSSFDLYAQTKGREAGFRDIFYNSEMHFDLRGNFLGFFQQPYDADYKKLQVQQYLSQRRFLNRDLIYFGDGYTDESVARMRNVQIVAVNTKNSTLIRRANACIVSFREVSDVLLGLKRDREQI